MNRGRKILVLSIALGIITCIFNACSTNNYREEHRPQFHFTPESHWMNDPNGMVYYDGEYHLFYQHNPDSSVWGPMHWGHAISKDLIHWDHLPIALYPDSLGTIFSGSAVIDWKNTSKLQTGEHPPMVAIFTYHDAASESAGRIDFQTQAIAYSNDRGRTWVKYDGNPVIASPGIKDFRDPKVIWHEESNRWILVLAAKDRVQFYASENLKEWDFLSEFGENEGAHGGFWECPDLFPLQVDRTQEQKWILIVNINPGGPNGGSAAQYFIGEFDGEKFINDNPAEKQLWIDYGRDNYAGVTWSDVPESDGRRIFLGWMSNWDYANIVPTDKWRSAMTIPRELVLKTISDSLILHSLPVKEMQSLRESENLLSQGKVVHLGESSLYEVIMDFEVDASRLSVFGIEMSNAQGEKYRVGFHTGRKQFFSDRTTSGKTEFSEKFANEFHTAPGENLEGVIKFHVFFDVASAEVFINDGAVVLTEIFFPHEPYNKVRIFAEGGAVNLLKTELYELKSTWN